MSRALKAFALIAIAEMVAVQLAALLSRWPDITPLSRLTPFEQRTLFGMAFFPVWVGFGLFMQVRQLAQPTISREQRTLLQWGMAAAILFDVVCHNMLALAVPKSPLIGDDVFKRVVLLAAGVLTVVYGNFRPKVAAPAHLDGSAQPRWSRTARRNGWVMVLFGLAEIIGAVVLSGERQMIALAVLTPAPVLLAVSELRLVPPWRRQAV